MKIEVGALTDATALLSRLDADAPPLKQAFSKAQAIARSAKLWRWPLEAPAALQRRYVRGQVSEMAVDRDKAVISDPKAAIAAAITTGHIKSGVPTFYGNGAPERIRTSDPQIRSLVLYPAELRAPSQGRRTYWGSRTKASGPFRFWHTPEGQSSSILVALRQVPAPPTDFGDMTAPAPLSRAMGVGKSGGGPGAVVFRVCWACDMRANMRRKSQEHGRG